MKFAFVLILALLGMILFGVFYDNKRAPSATAGPAALPSAASSPSSPTPASPSLLSRLLSALPPASSTPSSSSGQTAATLLSFVRRAAAAPSITPHAALMIAHGDVAQKIDAGLLVDCGLPYIDPTSKSPLSAGPTNEMTLRHARFARESEAQHFGPLTCVQGGIVQPSTIDPGEGEADKYLIGVVLMVGYPADAPFNKGLNVVVAPASPLQWQGKTYQAVTATFNTEPATPAPSGWWMWHKRGAGTVLDR